MSDGRTVHFTDVPDNKRLRRRAELDYDQFPQNIRTQMSTTYRSCISDEDLDSLNSTDGLYDWCDHMNEVALASKEAGNLKPKSKAARSVAVAVTKVKSTGPRNESGTTVPLTSLPGYAEAKRKADQENYKAYKAFCADALPKSFRDQIDREANAWASSFASSSRRPPETVTQVIRSNAPSDGRGCNNCGGNHYARDCPNRRGPYDRR